MIACRIAPGLNREFLSEEWDNLIPKKEWYGVVEEAQDMVCEDAEVQIQGYDIDGEVIKAARENAERAGVDHMIHFQERPVAQLSHPKKYGFIITNPPYKYALEFVQKALDSVQPGKKVAMFLKLQFLEGKSRKQFFLHNPPKVVYVSSSRLICAMNGEFEKYPSSAVAYAWFVWEKGFKGDPIIKWIN